jgi:uncharacterized protein DUF3187
MRKRARATFFPVTLGLFGAASLGAAEHESTPWTHLGLLRIRDLTPFGILRLDFLPAHAVQARKGTWGLELNLSYQNTYVLSDNVAEYLRARGGGERVEMQQADVDAILATGGDAYLVDGELGLFDLTGHYRFSKHWGGYVTLPVLVFNDGVLDATIESFHSALGLDSADRDLSKRNEFFSLVRTRDGTVVLEDPPEDGFADPVFGARWSYFAEPKGWNLVVEAAAKVAFRDAEFFLSSGHNDYGVQASYQKFFESNALYTSLSMVYFQGVDLAGAPDEAQWVPTFLGGWETRLGRHTNLVLQLYASPSVIENSSLRQLTADKFQASAGLQWAIESGWVWRFAFTENLVNFDNTPDIGVTLSAAKVFRPSDR